MRVRTVRMPASKRHSRREQQTGQTQEASRLVPAAEVGVVQFVPIAPATTNQAPEIVCGSCTVLVTAQCCDKVPGTVVRAAWT